MLVGCFLVLVEVQGVLSSFESAATKVSKMQIIKRCVVCIDGFKHLAKNVSANCSVPSLSGDELKCKHFLDYGSDSAGRHNVTKY